MHRARESTNCLSIPKSYNAAFQAVSGWRKVEMTLTQRRFAGASVQSRESSPALFASKICGRPSIYRIVVAGKGAPGFLKGTGDLDLEEQAGGTLIKYTGDLQLGGTIASVGQRMIQGTAKMMASQFFTTLEAEAQTKAGDPPPKHGFFRTALRWFSGWLRKLFGSQ